MQHSSRYSHVFCLFLSRTRLHFSLLVEENKTFKDVPPGWRELKKAFLLFWHFISSLTFLQQRQEQTNVFLFFFFPSLNNILAAGPSCWMVREPSRAADCLWRLLSCLRPGLSDRSGLSALHARERPQTGNVAGWLTRCQTTRWITSICLHIMQITLSYLSVNQTTCVFASESAPVQISLQSTVTH